MHFVPDSEEYYNISSNVIKVFDWLKQNMFNPIKLHLSITGYRNVHQILLQLLAHWRL